MLKQGMGLHFTCQPASSFWEWRAQAAELRIIRINNYVMMQPSAVQCSGDSAVGAEHAML